VIRVRDTGIGIPSDMLVQIFEMFTQVVRHQGRSQGGLGIGLTLVKRLIEMHGGTIEAFSEGDGKGAEFIVRLPLTEPEIPLPAGQDREKRDAASRHRRILVVDDNADAADSLGELLRLIGHDVRIAHDGLAGLQHVPTFRPEVVLLDLGMPGMDGFETARRIRGLPEGRTLTLVALTGWGQDEDRRRTSAAGFNLHVVKPVEPSVLQELIVALPAC
jgi:CheY-like chemotaxis protein